MTRILRELIKSNPAHTRRDLLKRQMSELEARDKNCFQCEGGWCCTFEYNSMRMTPLEAFDLYSYLEVQGRITSELLESLVANRKQYRLDKEIYTGRGQELRRTYTCPFFKDQSLGCSISRDAKPYGCLAFNALEENVSKRGHCESNQMLLENQAKLNASDKKINELLVRELKLDWNKKDIPTALIDIHHKLQDL